MINKGVNIDIGHYFSVFDLENEKRLLLPLLFIDAKRLIQSLISIMLSSLLLCCSICAGVLSKPL